MPTSNERLAASLTVLQQLQGSGRRVFQSSELTRAHRERLLESGYLQEVIRGWLISASPGARAGDSTPWHASFWEFCARYSEDRFGEEWHLSPEQSMCVHAANTVIPPQAIVNSPKGNNNKMDLLFGTSLFDVKAAQMPPPADLTVRDGLRIFTPAAALVRVSESFFRFNPIESRVVLAGVREASDLLRRLLDGGHSVVAGRLAGAFTSIGRPTVAREIATTMKAAGYVLRQTDPFTEPQPTTALHVSSPPTVMRMEAMWKSMRDQVLAVFPKPPGRPRSKGGYMTLIDVIYRRDAYHSLSIEGYTVTPELVERVKAGNWDPDKLEADRQSHDALAARGYWQAFEAVKGDVKQIIAGVNPGALIRRSHRDWYRQLFEPCVQAGLLPPGALAGYRNDAVFLRTSRYVPPRWEAVRDAVPALFDLLEQEPEPGVRAVLGHWMFGYIHPYLDGNGRIARFLMNAMLASGGYPWTVIRVEDRVPYLAALDRASIGVDIVPFARFLAERVRMSKQDNEEAWQTPSRPNSTKR